MIIYSPNQKLYTDGLHSDSDCLVQKRKKVEILVEFFNEQILPNTIRTGTHVDYFDKINDLKKAILEKFQEYNIKISLDKNNSCCITIGDSEQIQRNNVLRAILNSTEGAGYLACIFMCYITNIGNDIGFHYNSTHIIPPKITNPRFLDCVIATYEYARKHTGGLTIELIPNILLITSDEVKLVYTKAGSGLEYDPIQIGYFKFRDPYNEDKMLEFRSVWISRESEAQIIKEIICIMMNENPKYVERGRKFREILINRENCTMERILFFFTSESEELRRVCIKECENEN